MSRKKNITIYLIPHSYNYENPEANNDDMEALLQKYKVRKRLIPFFYRSDCGGYLSPKQCEALRMCLESPFIEPEIEYGYDAPWRKRKPSVLHIRMSVELERIIRATARRDFRAFKETS